jgi:hypothetical protein
MNTEPTYTDAQWNAIYAAAKATGIERYTDLMLSAEGNAQDTVYGEAEATVEQYNEIRFGTLMMLVCEEDEATAKWFAANGVIG